MVICETFKYLGRASGRDAVLREIEMNNVVVLADDFHEQPHPFVVQIVFA